MKRLLFNPFVHFGLLAVTFGLMWIPGFVKPLTPVFFLFLLTTPLTGTGLLSKWLGRE